MRRRIGVTLLLAVAITSAALAEKPKPMECDAWSCGEKCAPAKYEAVRSYWMPPWLLTNPLYGAAILESAAVGGLLLIGGIARRKRIAEPASTGTDRLSGEVIP